MSDSSTNVSRGLLMVMAIGLIGLGFAFAVASTNSSVLRAKLRQAETALEQARQGASTSSSPNRVVMLEELLREKDEAYARLQQQFADTETRLAAVPTPAPPAARERQGSWLERLKTEDPKRYAMIQEGMEERRRRSAQFFSDQLDRLDDRYRVAETREEIQLLEQIADALVVLDELRQQWITLRKLPREERREQARELGTASMEAYTTLVRLRAEDRQLQLDQLARQIGYQDKEETAAFVKALEQIFDETDTNPMRFWGGGHGFGYRSPP